MLLFVLYMLINGSTNYFSFLFYYFIFVLLMLLACRDSAQFPLTELLLHGK